MISAISEIPLTQNSPLYEKRTRFIVSHSVWEWLESCKKSILRICGEIKDSKGLKTGEEALFTDYNLVFCFNVLRSEVSSEPNSNHCGIIWWQNSAEIKMRKVIFDTFK